MIMDSKKVLYSKGKNDECYTPDYGVRPILKYIPKDATVWCPFDKQDSEFVKQISRQNKVVYSHIDFGQNFFEYEPNEWDCIVSNPPFTETSTTTTTFASPINFSLEETLEIYYIKRENGPIQLTVQLEDNVGATYDFTTFDLNQSTGYARLTFDLSLVTGIDDTNVSKVALILSESATGQTILSTNSTNTTYDTSKAIEQTFTVTGDAVCKRIRIQARRDVGTTDDLQIAIANYFGTTLGSAVLRPADSTITMTDYWIDFDNQIQLIDGREYKILIQSPTNTWDVQAGNTDPYAGGSLFRDGTDTNRDLNFSLYTEAPSETLYFDDLSIFGASVYQASGSYLSGQFDFGITPDSLDLLYWGEFINTDDVEVRVKFAATQGGLAGATWSAWFTDPSGAANVLTGLTPQRWGQFEVQFTGGTTASSSSVSFVSLDYSVAAGSGSAEVISVVENTSAIPEQFMMLWEVELGTGTANLFISRDDGASYQAVVDAQNGELLNFTSDTGTKVKARVVLTGNAKLYGWAVATDQEFL